MDGILRSGGGIPSFLAPRCLRVYTVHVTPMQASPARSQSAPGLSSSGFGLESLAEFIASNYEGMGKSTADVLPELRRKGIVAGGNSTYSIQGRNTQMGAPEVAELLRLKVSNLQLTWPVRCVCR